MQFTAVKYYDVQEYTIAGGYYRVIVFDRKTGQIVLQKETPTMKEGRQALRDFGLKEAVDLLDCGSMMIKEIED